jgi:hypothetical protein
VPRFRAAEMVGRAVLVTLPSRAESSRGIHIETKDRQKPSLRAHGADVSDGGKESGRVGRLRRRSSVEVVAPGS